MDREGKDPYDLLEEIEGRLNISVHPLSWPIGIGKTFKGVYSLYDKSLRLFQPSKQRLYEETVKLSDINSPDLEKFIGEKDAKQLREDVELIQDLYGDLDVDAYLNGEIAPVFFGLAVNNFGVKRAIGYFP